MFNLRRCPWAHHSNSTPCSADTIVQTCSAAAKLCANNDNSRIFVQQTISEPGGFELQVPQVCVLNGRAKKKCMSSLRVLRPTRRWAMLSRRCLELACPRLTLRLSPSRSFHCSQRLSGFGGQMNDEDPVLLEAELKRYKKGVMALT